jgi:HK97 family phage portal protein
LAIAGRATKSFIPSLNSTDVDFLGGSGRSNEYKTKIDQITANAGWSYAANEAIVQPAAVVKLQLFQKMKDGEREEIFEHEILDLLKDPNNAHTGEQLRALHYTYLNFTGESYILMTDKSGPFEPGPKKLPTALQILMSQQVQFIQHPIYSESIVKVGTDEFPIASVIREINPNPASPYMGMSVIEASALTIDLDRKMKEWNSALIDNGAKPSLIFNSNEEMSDESYARWKAQFGDENTGAVNAGKPLLIEGGDAKPWMLTPSDLDFLGSRNFSRDEILSMWRTPAAVLGLIKDANRANMDAAFYIHTVVNVVPRVRKFVQQINKILVHPYDSTLELDFENPIPEDKVAKLADAMGGVNKWWTIDEVRAMYGMEALPDGVGEQLYVPGLTVSLDTVANPEPVVAVQNPDEDDELTEDLEEQDDDKHKSHSHDGVKKKT